ncbi:methyl-accepting chemotaxis protein [Photobacterium japonica]|uniref:methyl-accepting chemotaxis protein n=1 Tax=Photobacterium japonica TaxID=2910235 RepID=UPI003D0A31C8
MKKVKHTSVIRRMYTGFAMMVMVFTAMVFMMLDGTSRIHQQLQHVTDTALPLVSYSNQTSVRLLAADKLFKDFLTSQDPQRMDTYEALFTEAQTQFRQALVQLINANSHNPDVKSQLDALSDIETRYFQEAQTAMANYRTQMLAQNERQQSARHFQRLYGKLNGEMAEQLANDTSIPVKMMAKNYFMKLRQTETITSDALATEEISKIQKAMKDNKRYVNHVGNAYRSLSTMKPELKLAFDQPIAQYMRDIGRSGGALDAHYQYIDARTKLYDNIHILAGEIDKATQVLDSFRHYANQQMNNAIERADVAYQQGYNNAILFGGLMVTVALGIGWYIAQSVRKPLNATLLTLEALANGDMTKRSDINQCVEFSQLGVYINSLADNLQEILSRLSQASGELTSVAEKNQTTTNDAKYRLNEQRQQTASVATAMTEMEHSVTEVSLSAQNTMTRIHDVEHASQTGREVMNTNIQTTQQLAARLDESVQAVANLQQMSSNIGSILDVIRNIADQTNLLALNAAIEAARAGDQGRGFAVVADEVRVLAKRTTDSTAEIEKMIATLQGRASQTMSLMQSCVTEMDNSIEEATNAHHAMEAIQSIILEISQMSAQIAQAAEEQRDTTVATARSLEGISHIADANYNAMEEVASASQTLDALAHQQNDLVHRFKL